MCPLTTLYTWGSLHSTFSQEYTLSVTFTHGNRKSITDLHDNMLCTTVSLKSSLYPEAVCTLYMPAVSNHQSHKPANGWKSGVSTAYTLYPYGNIPVYFRPHSHVQHDERGTALANTGRQCNKSHIKCFHYGEIGHYANKCPKSKKDEDRIANMILQGMPDREDDNQPSFQFVQYLAT